MQELHSSDLFDGPEGCRYFTHNVECLHNNHYFLAGQLLAMSIAYDGPSSLRLNEQLYFMTDTSSPAFEDDTWRVLPIDARSIFKNSEVSSRNAIERFLSNHGDSLVENGIVNIYRLTLQNKEEYAVLIQKQFLFYRTSAEIQQFTRGMDSLGTVWQTVKENAAKFKPLLCTASQALDKAQFERLCVYDRSPEGSNNRIAEEQLIYSWEMFLQDIEDKLVPATFGELLIRHYTIPRISKKTNEIKFFTEQERSPNVSTCSLELWIPRGIEDPEKLREIMIRCLKESCGFL
ncbi:G2E3-like protein, partial [Mya arenaria]